MNVPAQPPEGDKPRKAFALSPADEPILLALARYYYLTQPQVQRLLYARGSRSYPSYRLRRLVENGYAGARQPPRPTRAGSTQTVYFLETRGRNHVRKLGIDVPDRFRRQEEEGYTYEHYAHALAVVDVFIAADLLCRADPRFSVAAMLPDRLLKQRPVVVSIAVADQLTGEFTTRTSKLIPDAFLLLRFDDGTAQRTFPLLLELDRATQQQRAWREKIRAYLAAMEGPYQEAFGQASLTVAVVAPAGDQRVEQLLAWTQAELALQGRREDADVFLFAGADPAVTDPVAFFCAPLWRCLGDRRPLPLLEPPEGGL